MRRFTGLDPAPGKLPFAATGGGYPTTKQDLMGMGYDHRYRTVHALFASTDFSSPVRHRICELYGILPVYL